MDPILILIAIVVIWVWLVAGFAALAWHVDILPDLPEHGAFTGLIALFAWPIVVLRARRAARLREHKEMQA